MLKASRADWYTYQVEMCPDTGEFHCQGMAHCGKQSAWSPFLSGSAWIKRCINPERAFKYVTKLDTRISGPYEEGKRPNFRHGKGRARDAVTVDDAVTFTKTEWGALSVGVYN